MSNIILNVDSYKLSHYKMYPSAMTEMTSYIEARSGGKWNEVVFFGLQMFLKEYLSKPITMYNVREAQRLAELHGEPFNEEGWSIIVNEFGGYLPLEIQAIKEGTVVPTGVPVVQFRNTDPRFAWLPAYMETVMLRAVWYPCTVATNALMCRNIIEQYLYDTGCKDIGATAKFMLHDFGARGSTSHESAGIGSAAHQMVFMGTDTIEGIVTLQKYYSAGIESFSIPAMDHSTVTTWNEEYEDDAFENALNQYLTEGKILACVIDSYDINRAVNTFCTKFKDRIMTSGGRCVLRPDCYSEDTEILTNSGWKYFKDLSNIDMVAQVLDDGTYEFIQPIKYIKQQYNGDMVHYKDYFGKIDLIVTPNHRMIFDKNGTIGEQFARDCTFYYNKDIIRSAAAHNMSRHITPLEQLKLAFQSDGSYNTKGSNIRFQFSKQRKIDRLISILNACDLSYKIYNSSDGRTSFDINIGGNKFLKDLSWIDTRNLCSTWCKEVIEEISYWDGTRRNEGRIKFDTTNADVIKVIEIIAISAGYGCLVSVYEDNRSELFNDVYTAHILKDNLLGGQSISKEIISYSGYVYCVTVPSGKILVRRNGGQLVCGNSGDPIILCTTLAQRLMKSFGYTTNDAGYYVLPDCVRILFGDGIDITNLEKILKHAEMNNIAAENFVFGMGGGLLQGVTRDTLRFACKTNEVIVDGERRLVFKKTPGKQSKAGRMAVDINTYEVVAESTFTGTNALEIVYKNGILYKDYKFRDIRL